MSLINKENIKILNNLVDGLGDCIFIGDNANKHELFLKEIVAVWKNDISNFPHVNDILEAKGYLYHCRNEIQRYIKQQSEIGNSNLMIINNISSDIYNNLLETIKTEKVNNFALFAPNRVKGDKDNAIKMVTSLKNDFGFELVLINSTDNWDKVGVWAKKVRKNLTNVMKLLDIPKEVINLNGKMSLSYISPLFNKGLYGKFSDHYNYHYTIHLRPNTDKSLLSTLLHEYTHMFDRLSAYKYNEQNKINDEDSMRDLSSYLLNEAVKGNYSFNQSFLREYQKMVVGLVSTDQVENLHMTYNKKLEECIYTIKNELLKQLLGDKIEAWHNFTHTGVNKKILDEQLNGQIEKIFISGSKKCNLIGSPIYRQLTSIFMNYNILSNEDLNSFIRDIPHHQKKLNDILAEQKIKNQFVKNKSNDKGIFLNTDFMNNILQACYTNKYPIDYWANIGEILARHTQAINKENRDQYGKYKLFHPVINNKKEYIKLLKNMARYCNIIEDKALPSYKFKI